MSIDLGHFLGIRNFTASSAERQALEWKNQERIIELNAPVEFWGSESEICTIYSSSLQERTSFLNKILLREDGFESFRFDGVDCCKRSEREKNWIRHSKIGFVSLPLKFVDLLNSGENIEYALGAHGLPLKARQEASERALRAVGLWEHRYKRPYQMNYAMRIRVGIAQAIAKGPRLLGLFDPTKDLNTEETASLITMLKEVAKIYSLAVVIATEDANLVREANTSVLLS